MRSGLLIVVSLLTACDEPLEDVLEAAELEEPEPAGMRTKAEGGALGDFDYCDDPTALCVSGEGDCDLDGQCDAGLICGINNGSQFGLRFNLDLCVDAGCENGVQDGAETGIDFGGPCGDICGGVNGDNEGFCTSGCPCAQGEGDCDSNDECDAGLTCINRIGDRFGLEALDGVCTGTLAIADLRVGDIIINEIMSNPNAVVDSVGEWLEIKNNTNIPFNLNGLLVRHNAGGLNFTITQNVVIQPKGYVVLAKNGNTAVNGGVTDDFDYANIFALGNAADSVVLDNGPLDIDRVVYNATFPNPVGASMELDFFRDNSVDNNLGVNWCPSVASLSGGDKGSPGADNRNCP